MTELQAVIDEAWSEPTATATTAVWLLDESRHYTAEARRWAEHWRGEGAVLEKPWRRTNLPPLPWEAT
jgi:hypothetical protein